MSLTDALNVVAPLADRPSPAKGGSAGAVPVSIVKAVAVMLRSCRSRRLLLPLKNQSA